MQERATLWNVHGELQPQQFLGRTWTPVLTDVHYQDHGRDWLFQSTYHGLRVACGYNAGGPAVFVGHPENERWLDGPILDACFHVTARVALELANLTLMRPDRLACLGLLPEEAFDWPPKKRLVVVNDSVIGMVHPDYWNVATPLTGQCPDRLHLVFEDWRPATLQDFEHFRLSPRGYDTDPGIDFPTT